MLGYREKLLSLFALAAAAPLGGVWIQAGVSPAFFVSALIALAAFAAGAYALRPVGALARGLRACADPTASTAPVPHKISVDAGRMLADMHEVTAVLGGLRERLAHRHPTTGLPTREPLLLAMDEALRIEAPSILGVIRFVDYDDLAAFDQDRADRALAAFAARLSGAVQPGRYVAQVDRDCFAVWFGDAPERQIVAGELQAMGYVLAQELTDDDLRIAPQVRLGAAVFPADASDSAGLLTRAFAALPKSRVDNGSRLNFFAAESSEVARERFIIEQGLRTAILRDEFLLYFQPVFDTKRNKVVGSEALLRWRHPELGLVSPGRFVPVLEQSGLMDEVGLWVLNAACRQARLWDDLGLDGLTMAVNLSARQCRNPGLAAMITRTLDRHGLSPGRLELELTETAAMEDGERTRALLRELRRQGIGVAIDDFGAGYSSLTYLKNLPFSKLKIDREFVDRVDERRDSQAICAALVELARRLEITVLSEGVERVEEVTTLRALGCDIFQGYYFSRPLPADEFVARMRADDWGRDAAPAAPKPAPLVNMRPTPIRRSA